MLNLPSTEMRSTIKNHFSIGRNHSAPDYLNLRKTCQKIEQSTISKEEKLKALGELHEKRILEIAAAYGHPLSPIEAASELAQIKVALAVSAFSLAAKDQAGPKRFTLNIAGSAFNGLHTFLTDLDSIVIPNSEEDREESQKTQTGTMANLSEMHIDADWIMPSKYNKLKLEDFTRIKTWEENSAASNVFMDMRAVKATPANIMENFQARLKHLKEASLRLNQTGIINIQEKSFNDSVEGAKNDTGKEINLKRGFLRPLQFMFYAARAKLKILNPDTWDLVAKLRENKTINPAEEKALRETLIYVLHLRHLISFCLIDTEDSVTLTDNVVNELSAQLQEDNLIGKLLSLRQRAFDIASKVFKIVNH